KKSAVGSTLLGPGVGDTLITLIAWSGPGVAFSMQKVTPSAIGNVPGCCRNVNVVLKWVTSTCVLVKMLPASKKLPSVSWADVPRRGALRWAWRPGLRARPAEWSMVVIAPLL